MLNMFAFRVLMEKFATSELLCLRGSRLGVSNLWPTSPLLAARILM